MMCALRRSSARRAFWRRNFCVLLIHRMALGLGPAFLRSLALRGCRWPAHAARLASSDEHSFLPGEAELLTPASCGQPQPRLPAGCSVCIPQCRFAALPSRTTSGSGHESFWQRTAPRVGCCCTALRLATLASAPFRGSHAPEGRTPREFSFISPFFFLALLIN